jgi:hypothetical protein
MLDDHSLTPVCACPMLGISLSCFAMCQRRGMEVRAYRVYGRDSSAVAPRVEIESELCKLVTAEHSL